ncbi:MAG: hypothetical protein AB1649_20195 [Chloroflexota bacterium]
MSKHKLITRASKGASITETQNGFRLKIPASQKFGYRLAQLDDYNFLPRRKFPHHSLTLSLRARASSRLIPGTWGFGIWNDPFVLSLGLAGVPFRMPALPNAAWFFHASPESHLSFTEAGPGSGFLAQTFRAPRFHPLLIPAGLAIPFSRKVTRRLLGRAIDEEEIALSVDVTQWHGYRLEWSQKRVLLEVDDVPVLETSVSPRGPLGVVIWIDNQYAAFTPEGKIAMGFLEGKEEWIEIQDVQVGEPQTP